MPEGRRRALYFSTMRTKANNMRSPQQSRSVESLERCLDATEELIRERGFDNVTVVEVVKRANFSVGGLYTRFHNKAALLDAVMERFWHRTEDAFTARLRAEEQPDESLGQLGERIVRTLVEHLLSDRLVLRAFILESASNPRLHIAEMATEERRKHVCAALLSHRDEIGHDDPEYAVRWFYAVCMAVIRERVVHGEKALIAGGFDDEQLITELTGIMTGYLAGHRSSLAGHSI